MVYQVYVNGKKFTGKVFDRKDTAEVNVELWRALNPGVSFSIKEVRASKKKLLSVMNDIARREV